MVMRDCPHCGKPLRPGSRFCGNCGKATDIIAAKPSPGYAGVETNGPDVSVNTEEANQAGLVPCPHCGKPVRPGAKFCHNCGQAIPAETPAGQVVMPEAGSVESTAPVAAFQPQAPAGSSNARVAEKRRKGRTAIPLVMMGIILACVAAITGGYIYLRDPFNWFTGNQLALQSSNTPVPSQVSPTSTPSLAQTQIPATESLTPTSTPTVEPTDTAIPTSTVSQPFVLLLEDFDGALNEQWVVWLKPESPSRPKISTGPGENFLELMAVQEPGEAGVTTREEIPIETGLDVQFIGQLKEDLPRHVIILDWDPIDTERGPLSTVPGKIHLEIWRDKLIFGTLSGEVEGCQSPIVGYDEHSYRIFIEQNQDMALYVDGSQDPVCILKPVFNEPVPGYLTFTGAGWITKVQVTAPAE